MRTFVVIIVLLTLLSFFSAEQYMAKSSGKPRFLIELKNISNVLFLENHIILETTDEIYLFKLKSNEIIWRMSKPENILLGQTDEEFIACIWENFIITEPKEIATNIKIVDTNLNLIRNIESEKTVRPTNCSIKEMSAIDNYPGAPGREYIYANDDFVQLNQPNTDNLQEEISELFIRSFSEKEGEWEILIDRNNGVWYREK